MSEPTPRTATITAPDVVARVWQLRRLMLTAELSLWCAFAVTVLAPGEVIASCVLTFGLLGLAVLEMQRSAIGALQSVVGRQRIVLEKDRGWVRLTSQHVPGAWSFDLATGRVPAAPLLAVAVMTAAALTALGAVGWVPLAIGGGLVHLVAVAVLRHGGARRRVVTALSLLGCVAAVRQFVRHSTEDQTRAAAGLLLLLLPVAAGWALERSIWDRVRSAPNLRRRLMTLLKAEGSTAAAAGLPLLLMLVALVFAYSRGLVLTMVTAAIVGVAAQLKRAPMAIAMLLAGAAAIVVLSPPRDGEATALVILPLLALGLALRHAWPQPWLAASLTAGAFHVAAVRPFVTAALTLAYVTLAAMPQKKTAEATGSATAKGGARGAVTGTRS